MLFCFIIGSSSMLATKSVSAEFPTKLSIFNACNE